MWFWVFKNKSGYFHASASLQPLLHLPNALCSSYACKLEQAPVGLPAPLEFQITRVYSKKSFIAARRLCRLTVFQAPTPYALPSHSLHLQENWEPQCTLSAEPPAAQKHCRRLWQNCKSGCAKLPFTHMQCSHAARCSAVPSANTLQAHVQYPQSEQPECSRDQ